MRLQKDKKTRLQEVLKFLIIVGLTVIATACSMQKSPVTGEKRAYGYSWQEEVRLGKKSDKSIQQEYGIYKDSAVVKYVRRVGRNVLEVSHMRRPSTPEKYRETEFTFRVLNSPVVNAFALPGGYIYVTRGLLAHLNNEAQLAVVLGHEIGHVAARHSSQRALEQKMGQIALVGGSIVGQEVFGLSGQDILQVGGTATRLLFMKYSRDDERESDRLGVEYAAKAGYKASEGSDFFTSLRRISNQGSGGLPTLLSTHPDPGDREQKIPELADKWKEKGYQMKALGRESYFDMLDGMVYGDNPRAGFVRNNVFYHPELAFQFPIPDEWKLFNRRSSVILVESDKNAVVKFTIDPKAETAQRSVTELLAKKGITVVSQQKIRSKSFPAYRATAVASGREGKVKLYIYALDYKNNIYRFLGYSALSSFDRYLNSMSMAAEGFQALSDKQILNINPVRLQTITANQSIIFEKILPQPLPMDVKAERIAIVNQLYLDTRIEQGTLIKIPQQ